MRIGFDPRAGLATNPRSVAKAYKKSRAALGEKLRRLGRNGSYLHDNRPWKATPAWQTGVIKNLGNVVVNSAGEMYVAIGIPNPGVTVTGATEPVHTGSTRTAWDGTANSSILWSHVGQYKWTNADDVGAPSVTSTGSANTPGGYTAVPIWANRTKFTLRGCEGQEHALSGGVLLHNYYSDALATPTASRGGGSIVFDSDALGCAFGAPNSSQGVTCVVDDRFVTFGALGSQSSIWEQHVVEFAGRGVRRWEFHFGQSTAALYRLSLKSTDQIWAVKDELSIGFIGDSWLAGSGNGPYLSGNVLSEGFGRAVGVPNCRRYAAGGTALYATNGGFYTFRQRLPQVLANNHDVIVVQGSPNDITKTHNELYTEALAFIDTIRNSGSTAPVVWFGPAPLSGNYAALQTFDQAVSDAFAARAGKNVKYVSLITSDPPLFQGTHNGGVYLFSNITQYIGDDAIHPVDKGTLYVVRRLARLWFDVVIPWMVSDEP